MEVHLLLSLLLLLLLIRLPVPLSAVDVLFNGFSSPSELLLYGDATVPPSTGSRRHLSLTSTSNFSVGRALLPSKVTLIPPNSSTVVPFSTSFIFSMSPVPSLNPGHGIALLFSPLPGLRGSTAAQHLGLFNRSTDADPSNGVLAVELDVFENAEFHDIDDNHVGIDVFSLTSAASHPAGYFPPSSPFVPFRLNSGENYQAWVDHCNSTLNITLAPAGLPKPTRPLISTFLDLSFFQSEMYVGFCAATGKLVQHHRILAWSFSTSNLSLSTALITSNLPNFMPADSNNHRSTKTLRISVTIVALLAGVIIATAGYYVVRKRCRAKLDGERADEAPAESWESEYWPHRISWEDIKAATDGFSEKNLIGSGGNGRVYKSVLAGEEVAVKRFHRGGAGFEMKGFLAEVTSLGRLRHRNLVGLRGWCKKGGDLILVYEYMKNGNLEERLFGGNGRPLDWKSRTRILRDVAEGVLYLHEGWGRRVLHRDIKASNVMLDAGMTGRLGDFGQAKVYESEPTATTHVVGTAGYIAPELVRNGKATVATDVYAFGVLALEVASGTRGSDGVVEWARKKVGGEEELDVVDAWVKGGEGFDEREARTVVRLGVWCTCEEQTGRPGMREVVRVLQGDATGVEELLARRLAEGAARHWTAAGGLECCYRSALGLDPDHRHPTWEEMGLSSSAASLSASDVLHVGR